MKCRMVLTVYLLLTVFAVCAARAQGVVVESVDDDIVEEAPVKAKDSAAVKGSDTAAVKASEPKGLDLDALFVEDDDDLLLGDKIVVKEEADTAVVDSLTSETAGGKAADADSASRGEAASGSAEAEVKSAEAKGKDREKAKVKADLGPTEIEDGKAVNFAHNLKEYRSPRLAMLMSLLVPGLGQAYSRSYIKAGAFGAAELAAIGVAVWLNSKGKTEKDRAYKYADTHYSVDKLKDYQMKLEAEYEKRVEDIDKQHDQPFKYYDQEFYSAAEKKQTFYYESIRDPLFVPGWKDNEPAFEDILKLGEGDAIDGSSGRKYRRHRPDVQTYFYYVVEIVNGVEKGGPMLGYSANQSKYNSMIDKANSYHDAVNYTLYALLLNHIASAIDAGFTARAYNARMLGEASALERLSIEQMYVFTGSEVSPGLALRVRF